mgnify:CR=1 FL=1
MSEEVGEALEYSDSIIEEGDDFVTQEATTTEESEAQEDAAPEEAAPEEASEFNDALSALDTILGEEDQEEEVEANAEDADVPKEGRANRRIRGLNSDLKQANEANAQMQQQVQNMQTQYAQQQQEAQQRFLDALQNQNQQEVDPATELRQDLVNQTTAKLDPQLATLKNELASLKGNMQREAQEAQSTAQRQEYIRDADIATREVFFGGETDNIDSELQEGLSTMTMMYQWLTGADAKDSAKMAKRTALQYAKAELGRQGKAMKAKRQASLETESPAPQGKSNVIGDTSPSLENLRRNGFTDELDWAINGSPTLNS